MPPELSELLTTKWHKLRPGRQILDGSYLTILLNDTNKASVRFTVAGRFISCKNEVIPEEKSEENDQ